MSGALDDGTRTWRGWSGRPYAARAIELRGAALDDRRPREVAGHHVDHLSRVVVDDPRQHVHLVQEEVVGGDGDDGDRQAERRGDQGQGGEEAGQGHAGSTYGRAPFDSENGSQHNRGRELPQRQTGSVAPVRRPRRLPGGEVVGCPEVWVGRSARRGALVHRVRPRGDQAEGGGQRAPLIVRQAQ